MVAGKIYHENYPIIVIYDIVLIALLLSEYTLYNWLLAKEIRSCL